MKTNYFKYFFIGLLMLIFILVTIVQFYTFNLTIYKYEFDKYDIYQNIDLDYSGVEFSAKEIIKYLKNDSDNLYINYNDISVFNERELSHMEDVKKIFIFINYLKNISILLAIFLLVVDKKIKTLLYSFVYLGINSLILIGVMLLTVLIDFSKAFTLFHRAIFNNDLWLLNPNTDRLIQMLPEGFFSDMALYIIMTHLTIVIILATISFLNLKKIGKES